jgi:hypothetical protein
VVFDAGLKKFQETPPRIDAGLGVSLRCTTHTEQTTEHALNLQPERTRGSRSARHEDEMSRALVFQMPERIGVMMHLKPAHCDVGERRRWPHLIVGPRDKQNRSSRLLHGDRRALHGARIAEVTEVERRESHQTLGLNDGRWLMLALFSCRYGSGFPRNVHAARGLVSPGSASPSAQNTTPLGTHATTALISGKVAPSNNASSPPRDSPHTARN